MFLVFFFNLMKTLRSLLKKDKSEPDILIQICEPANTSSQTDRFLAIIEGKMFIYSQFNKVVKTFYLNTLNQFECNPKGYFFTFDTTKFSFQTDNDFGFVSIFKKIVQSMLTEDELHRSGMEIFKNDHSLPNLKSVIWRIRNRAEMLQIETVDDTIDRITRIHTYQESKIIFREFKNVQDAFQLVLDILPLCPFITSLTVFSAENFDPFAYLSDFASRASSIDTYRIEGPVTPKFDKFLVAIQSNERQKILGLTFDGSHFTAAAIRTLASCIAAKTIPSVCFRNALKPDTVNTFYNYFLPGPVGSKLKFLCVDSTPSVKVSTLVAKLSALTALSITNCGLDIGKIFSAVSNTRIRTLDVSGNTCSSLEADIEKPPSSLAHIIANGVTFGTSALVNLFEFIAKNFTFALKLSLARAEASTQEWIQLFKSMKTLQLFSLREFVWDSNPVHSYLFSLLQKNTKIHTLSMQGCFHELDMQPLLSLINYLPTCTARKIILSSNENAYLGRYFVPVCSAVCQNSSLEYLDVNWSKGGDDGVSFIKTMLQSSIKVLHCDGLEPSSASLFVDMIDAATSAISRRNLRFFFPQSDFDDLLKSRKLRHTRFEQLKDSLMEAGHGSLYHGECHLEFAELTKNLSTVKLIKDSSISSIKDTSTASIKEVKFAATKTSDEEVAPKKKRHRRMQTMVSDEPTIEKTLDMPMTMDSPRRKKIKKVIKRVKTKKNKGGDNKASAISDLAAKRNSLPPPKLKIKNSAFSDSL